MCHCLMMAQARGGFSQSEVVIFKQSSFLSLGEAIVCLTLKIFLFQQLLFFILGLIQHPI